MGNMFNKFMGVLIIFVISLVNLSISDAQDRFLLKFEPNDSIEVIQEKIKRNGFQFTVGRNWVYDLSDEEKAKLLRRRIPTTPRGIDEPTDIGPLEAILQKRIVLPASYDSRNDNGKAYIGKVLNQGKCGCCYSFGATAAAEGAYNKANGFFCDPTYTSCSPGFADFSEAFIAFCLSKYPEYIDHFNECNGADYDYYELDALVKKGTISEQEYPYQETNPGKCSTGNIPFTPSVKFESWHRIPCADVEAIKAAIMTYGVVDAAVLVTNAFMAYKSGIYEDTTTTCNYNPCYYSETNHAVALVGWNDNNGKGYWILRNSWGPYWGENGYMRISYHAAHVSCEASYLVYNAQIPKVTTLPAENVKRTSVDFRATINPRGKKTTFYFEFGTQNVFDKKTQQGTLDAIDKDVSIVMTYTNLQPELTYYYRVVATNDAGTSVGEKKSFFTSEGGITPSAITGAATSVTATSAILNAVINPKGDTTSYYFEYGPTTSYGSILSQPTYHISGSSDVTVSDSVLKLIPSTTYHYRVVATNSSGTTYGLDQTFTTENANTNIFRDGSFEAGQPNPYWEDEAALQIKNIYKIDTTIPNNPKPTNGDWLIWFAGGGNYGNAEKGFVAQNFIIPKSSIAELKFDWQKYCPCGVKGIFTVKLDSEIIFEYSYDPMTDLEKYREWQSFSKDISAYADGRPHTLRFEVDIEKGTPELDSTDFLVDNVTIRIDKPTLDVNNDGEVTLGDVVYLLQVFSGIRKDVSRSTTIYGNTIDGIPQTKRSNISDGNSRLIK